MDRTYKGMIISESLNEPSVINDFEVYKAEISKDELEIDYKGNKGRWHLYWVRATKDQIDKLHDQIKKGWYAHFWGGNKIIAVFKNKKFEFLANDRTTWEKVIQHGKSIGIPEDQLDFPTD